MAPYTVTREQLVRLGTLSKRAEEVSAVAAQMHDLVSDFVGDVMKQAGIADGDHEAFLVQLWSDIDQLDPILNG